MKLHFHFPPGSNFVLHGIIMSSTNLVNDYNTEGSADAAFGLVALCDSSHISEEVVETTEYVSDEYAGDHQDDNVQVFLQNLKPEDYHQFQVEQGPSGETFLSVAHIGSEHEANTQYFITANEAKSTPELVENDGEVSSHLHHAVIFQENQDATQLVVEELGGADTEIEGADIRG